MLRVLRDEPVEFATTMSIEECADRIRRTIAQPARAKPALTGRVGRSRIVLRPASSPRRAIGKTLPTMFVGRIVRSPAGTILAGSFTVGRFAKFGLSIWLVLAGFLLLNGMLSVFSSRGTAGRALWIFIPGAVIFAIAALDVVLSSLRRRADIEVISRSIAAALER